MQLEQQQRIMGYFIEEAKDHLNTIEQGLLNLQVTIDDTEMLNEVFRAAHSVKGGAAMLGLNSIQQTAHRLEDSFKILKENRLPPQYVDQQLESLFLQIFDTLQALIDQLSGPYGLTEEAASALLQDVEPVFEALNYHIKNLVQQHGVGGGSDLSGMRGGGRGTTPLINVTPPVPVVSADKDGTQPASSAKDLVFRSDIPEQLREMLQQFKQPETLQTRQRLEAICQSLATAGELFDLPHWVTLIETVEQAIANPNNSYRQMAPVVIKSIKEAAELVLMDQETSIIVTDSIKSLLPKPIANAEKQGDTKKKTGVAKSQKSSTTGGHRTQTTAKSNSSSTPAGSRSKQQTPGKKDGSTVKAKSATGQGVKTAASMSPHAKDKATPSSSSQLPNLGKTQWSDSVGKEPPARVHNGPEITAEEYNSLRDLFEGLDDWEEHGISQQPDTQAQVSVTGSDTSADILDLLEAPDQQQSRNGGSTQAKTGHRKTTKTTAVSATQDSDPDDLASFFDSLTEEEPPTPKAQPQMAETIPMEALSVEGVDDFFDELLTISPPDTAQEEKTIPTKKPPLSPPAPQQDGLTLLDETSSLDELFDQFESNQTDAQVSTLALEETTLLEPLTLEEGDWFEQLLQTEAEDDDVISHAFVETRPGEAIPKVIGASVPSHQLINSPPAPVALDDGGEADLFSDLDQLLQAPDLVVPPQTPTTVEVNAYTASSKHQEDDVEFKELEQLIEETQPRTRPAARPLGQFTKTIAEPIVKVPVKQLDNLSNLMGELVVNRNSLEQDQERMRQFLDNLLHQVSLLGDVGQRMQDFYERSLLEISLLSNRRKPFWFTETSHSHHDDDSSGDLDSTELDRFTPFHTLSQEIIELIVRVRESSADIEFLVEEADQVTRQLRQISTALQEGLTRARMEPFASEADALKRPVRDISIKCGKQAELFVEGRDTLIDKMLLGKLHDPLIHLVNNAITHGIEPTEVRVAAGKSPVGRITIRVFHQGNQTIISVSDDGGGIDVNRVKNKAIQKGIITPEQGQNMTNPEIYDLLFLPNFSTKDVADEYAGRGVGMDVVRTSLTDIRGTITTDSTLGKGTTFTIRLPLNMSISRALCCISDRVRIAFPMDGVEDMIDVPREQVRTLPEGTKALEWRGTILPLRHLRELLTYQRHLGRGNVYGANAEEDMISVIVLRSSNSYLAVQVDQVLIEQEIVIKQLEGPVPKPIGIAGATVLGDGQIVAIADVLELIDLAMGRIRKDAAGKIWNTDTPSAEPPQQKSEPTVLIVDDSITVRSLLSITFEKSGYRVEEARDGKEAWEKLKSGLPCDIVFCDIEMPRMDGLELLSRMQKDPVLTDLPIAMLTSRGADRHRQMAFNLGARGYFTKPYLEEQLLEAAGRMLKGEVVGNTVISNQ